MKEKHNILQIFVLLMSLLILFIGSKNQHRVWAQDQSSTGSFAYMANYDSDTWQLIHNAPFHICTFSGTVERGIVVFGGFDNKQGAFTTDIVNGRWETIADAPFTVHHCAGSNVYGSIICGGEDNRKIAYMKRYKDNVWQTVTTAPFFVTDITGTNDRGPIIMGGPNRKKVAYMSSYTENKWYIVADAPFPVTAITGNNEKGVIIVGGENNRQVAYMSNYGTNKWTLIANAPFSVFDIAGNNVSGAVIIGGKDNKQVSYMTAFKENKWRIVANSPISISEISGSNDGGIIVAKIDQKSRVMLAGDQNARTGDNKTRETVLKTAVVEFQERGSLGMQDAGTIIAEWLTTALNKTGGFEVYERLSLSTLLEEHRLGTSGLMDEKSIAEIGRIRGVEAIVTGSVSKLGSIYSVTAKVIDVATAKIITSADIKVNDVNAIVAEIDKLAWELAKE